MNAPLQSSPIAFAGAISLEEFARVQKLLLPATMRWYFSAPLVALAFFCVTGFARDPFSLAFDVLGAASMQVVISLMIRRFQKRAWVQAAQIVGRVHGAITPAGIDWVTDRSTSHYEWARIVDVKRVDGLTLALYAPRCAFYFPRSFFESDAAWAAFNEALTAYTAR